MGRDRDYSCLLGSLITIKRALQKVDHYLMSIDINFIPARRDMPPVSVYIEKSSRPDM